MVSRFWSNQISQATSRIAGGILSIGLVLVGFGVLILVLPTIFVAIAAGLFFFAGISCALYAAKLLLAMRKLKRQMPDENNAYRKNVTIHIEENHE